MVVLLELLTANLLVPTLFLRVPCMCLKDDISGCSRALATINKDCRRLDHAAKARLAVALTNCHLRQLGQRTFQCTPRMSLKDCTEPMADRDFGVFNEFFSNVDR